MTGGHQDAPAPAEGPGPRRSGPNAPATSPRPAEAPGPRGLGPNAAARHPRPAPTPVPGSAGDRPSPRLGPSAPRDGAPPLGAPDPVRGAGERPADAAITAILAGVPDPEIPGISIVDLGVVRGLSWDGATLVVDVTPTYSGCPATAVIELAVEDALRRRGVAARVRRVLAPPWTTDWITAAGRAKLAAAGIAPPDPKGPGTCPHCGGARLEEVSRFGSTPCKAQWRCLDCREPFDHFKCH